MSEISDVNRALEVLGIYAAINAAKGGGGGGGGGSSSSSGSGGGDLLAANNLSDVANAATARTNLGLAIGTNVQAYSSVLATYAGINPSANVQTVLSAADFAAIRTALGLVIGTNVQAYDADLTTYAGITPSANVQSLLGAADYSAMRTLLGLVIGTNVQAYDADLTTWAGLTPSANAQSLVTAADYAAMRALLDLEAGTDFYSVSGADTAIANSVSTHSSDTTSVHGITDTSTLYFAGGTDVALADGGTGASLTDPNADRIMFWDDSAGAVAWLTAGTGLTITDTTITASGGQTLYDAIVAASGGDYTTLGAAITGGATTIFIREGSYSESAITSSVASLTIVGANPETTVLDFATNNLTLSGANLRMSNLKITVSTGDFTFSGTDSEFRGVKISKSGTSNDVVWSGAGQVIQNCFLETTGNVSAMVFSFNAANQVVTGNHFQLHCGSASGVVDLGSSANGTVFSGNYLERTNGTGSLFSDNAADYVLITGNTFYDAGNNLTSLVAALKDTSCFTGNFLTGGQAGIVNAKGAITGNNFYNCRDGIITSGTCTITGNHIWGVGTTSGYYGIDLAAANNTVGHNFIQSFEIGINIQSGATGAIVQGNTFGTATTKIANASVSATIMNNNNTATVNEARCVYMKNTSGGALAAGDLVVLKAVAAGNEVTTTTTGGDDMVFGMATAAISDNASGYIQTLGKTTALKVDGTTDIAVGDFISTFTTAKIGKKASAGDTAIAIALEAYATDDSSGVIDALLISPRKVGAVV